VSFVGGYQEFESNGIAFEKKDSRRRINKEEFDGKRIYGIDGGDRANRQSCQ